MRQSFVLVGEERPEWQKEAKCRGWLHDFQSMLIPDQQNVCTGDDGGELCPVLHECLNWFIYRCSEIDGLQTAYDNVLVHGGLTPLELLKVAQIARNSPGRQPPIVLEGRA